MKNLFMVLAFIGLVNIIKAQNLQKKPKVALVLSGGGAKGIAHIPVLKALDSLNIIPDLIIGTSMGSVVGSLYSSGYTGNQIEVMVKKMNWNDLLYGKIAFNDVSNEEKANTRNIY